MQYINYNGQLVRADGAHFGLENRALRYGDGVFETMKWTGGDLPLWSYHAERLLGGMAALHLTVPDIEDTAMHFYREISRLPFGAGDYRVRLLVFRAGGGTYAPATDHCSWVVEAKRMSLRNGFVTYGTQHSGGDGNTRNIGNHNAAVFTFGTFKTGARKSLNFLF